MAASAGKRQDGMLRGRKVEKTREPAKPIKLTEAGKVEKMEIGKKKNGEAECREKQKSIGRLQKRTLGKKRLENKERGKCKWQKKLPGRLRFGRKIVCAVRKGWWYRQDFVMRRGNRWNGRWSH